MQKPPHLDPSADTTAAPIGSLQYELGNEPSREPDLELAAHFNQWAATLKPLHFLRRAK